MKIKNFRANNVQINEDIKGDITMNVNCSVDDVYALLDQVKAAKEELGVKDPELLSIVDNAETQKPESLLARLVNYSEKVDKAVSAGEKLTSGVQKIALIIKMFLASCAG